MSGQILCRRQSFDVTRRFLQSRPVVLDDMYATQKRLH
jgi:hypothetical protein